MLIKSLFELLTVWIKDSGQKTAGSARAVYMSQVMLKMEKLALFKNFWDSSFCWLNYHK